MSLLEKMKRNWLYALAIWVATSAIVQVNMAYNDIKDRKVLDSSNYVLRTAGGSMMDLYGYDDNQDGRIDRIEQRTMVIWKGGGVAGIIRKAHLPRDGDFNWYNQRLSLFGKIKNLE